MKLTENMKIPKPKLRCYFKGLNKQVKFVRPKNLIEHMEKELTVHILNLESKIFGLTATDLRTLVYQLAEQYHLPHRFNKDKEIAGKKWYYKLMKDHPCLSLRIPGATSMNRATSFNKNTNYNLASLSWLRTNPVNTAKQTTVSELLGIAYSKSVGMEIALNDSKFGGIWPCNRYQFDYDFCTSTLATIDTLHTPPYDVNNQEQLSTV
ncbi:hypothetical protein EWB00_005649, partial [Schistosoma japonicum]